VEGQASLEIEEKELDYSQRSQWLRAAVLGATDGLVSTASLMMAVGSAKHDRTAMIVAGFAGLVAGACSMAIGEFVSVYSQLDIERAQMKRNARVVNVEETNQETGKEGMPNPLQAALASALAFCIGAMLPLLAGAFVPWYMVRLGVVAGSSTLGLLAFGAIGAVLGNAPVTTSCLRVLIGGWLAMAITIGLTIGVDKLYSKHIG
ncbi:hypothetical protein AQUCO_02300106v1, partial [Aquilegia coerulea]